MDNESSILDTMNKHLKIGRKTIAEATEDGIRERENQTKEFFGDASNLFIKWSEFLKSTVNSKGNVSAEMLKAIAEDTLQLLRDVPKELYVDSAQLKELKEIEFDLRRVGKAFLKV